MNLQFGEIQGHYEQSEIQRVIKGEHERTRAYIILKVYRSAPKNESEGTKTLRTALKAKEQSSRRS